MRDYTRGVEVGLNGDVTYLSNFFNPRSGRVRTDFDMYSLSDKRHALAVCTPLYMVADKLGSMMSRGIPYVVDDEDNDVADDVKRLLLNPNPLQTFGAFLKQVEISLKVFGYCPIVLVRGSSGSLPKAMWIVPCEYFHMQATGKMYRQFEIGDIVKRVYVCSGANVIDLEDYEFVVVYNGTVASAPCNADLRFESVTDGLTLPVNNWVAAMSASHTLLVNGGPKGIVYSDFHDEMGNVAISPDEERAIKDGFKRKYGLVDKEYPILVTRQKLGWIPLDYDAGKLMLQEEDARCTSKICNAFGVNPNLFSDAKYDNQESAKKSAYQDVVIPDANKIAGYLTRALCGDGVRVRIDFGDVECLQENRAQQAETLNRLAGAVTSLVNGGLLSVDEARVELSRYLDIDPGGMS